MTLPSVVPNNQCDDDSDMFGPPRTSPPIGYHHHRSRVPMISPKLRLREERKRIILLSHNKLEHIKDSELNLRRSVCIHNTYSRLNDEVRLEKQSRYLANLPRTESKRHFTRDNIFNPYNSCGIDSSYHQPSTKTAQSYKFQNSFIFNSQIQNSIDANNMTAAEKSNCNNQPSGSNSCIGSSSSSFFNTYQLTELHNQTATCFPRKRTLMTRNIETDLEILDRELSAINSPMPLIDPEITQGAEQLERAISLRKRQRSEEESDRLVREALSQFYIPPQRLISAIDDCPLDIVNVGSLSPKRQKMSSASDLDLDFDLNQNQKDFEVIMDALRLGSPSPTPSVGSDSCGQAAMLSESSNVFHNLVVTSLET